MSLTGPTKDGLTWSYYTGYFAENVNYFTGTPVASGVVTAIPDINGGTGGYVPVNDSREYYSVQWVGYFLSNYTGSWTFYTTSDDASYLWIGPNAVTGYTTMNANVNNSGLHGMVKKSGVVSLVAGKYYDLRIQFGENQYGDDMIVSFQNPGLSETTNGSGFFYTAGGAPAVLTGPQPKIFLGPLMSYPSATGTPPTNDGTKLSFVRDSSQYLNFGSQTFDMAKGFSATCKFAFTGAAGNYERLFDFGGALNSASNNITIMRYGTGAGFRVWIVNGTTAQNYYDVNYGIIQSEVTNLAAVYDPNAAQPYWSIYKNGIKLVPSNVTFVSKATGTRTLAYSYVGNSLFNWDAYTSADIYSLNIYNRVLTANELVGPVAPSPWGIFTATPNGLTVDQAAVSGLALKQGYPGYGDGTYWIKPTSGSVAGLAFVDMTTDGGGWTLAYETVSATRVNNLIVYSVNNSSNLAAISFTRVAYSMNNFNSWAFTSFDSWSSAVASHRVAAPNDTFVNQRRVYNLNVVSSNANITTGTGLYGALEIWPSNYSATRNSSVGTYGSDSKHDINDSGASTGNGYGCFQVHDITNFRPVICWNSHGGGSPDIGFGPNPNLAEHTDWTHTYKGATPDFRVGVYVR